MEVLNHLIVGILLWIDVTHTVAVTLRQAIPKAKSFNNRFTRQLSHGNNIRLVDGASPNQGRVEIYHNGEWGTICDDGFDDSAVGVVCRSLGFRAGVIIGGTLPGPGVIIWLDDVQCDGSESSITECTHRNWGRHNCGHSEDVAVRCQGTVPIIEDTTERHIRLAGGTSSTEGRLEILHDGEWGTVCDDYFDNIEAEVACRSMGYRFGRVVQNYLRNNRGWTIWLDDVRCTGAENSLDECAHRGWGIHNCGHAEDVAIKCEVPTGPVRLVGGPDAHSGRVEVFHNNQWGTVCDDNFFEEEAQVVCRSLMLSGGEARREGFFGHGSGPIWLDGLRCDGNESNIEDCSRHEWGDHDCQHSEDAGVVCAELHISNFVRLTGSKRKNIGRLEVLDRGVWGAVCDDSFNSPEATVACRWLGYRYGATVSLVATGPKPQMIHLDDLQCDGLESNLLECGHRPLGEHDCGSSEHVSVECYNETVTTSPPSTSSTRVRLVGGPERGRGRLVITHDGRDGSVCDDQFGQEEADVVCRSLGYLTGKVLPSATFGEALGRTWLDQVNCTGSEGTLEDCSHDPWGLEDCTEKEDVCLHCGQPIIESTEVPINGLNSEEDDNAAFS